MNENTRSVSVNENTRSVSDSDSDSDIDGGRGVLSADGLGIVAEARASAPVRQQYLVSESDLALDPQSAPRQLLAGANESDIHSSGTTLSGVAMDELWGTSPLSEHVGISFGAMATDELWGASPHSEHVALSFGAASMSVEPEMNDEGRDGERMEAATATPARRVCGGRPRRTLTRSVKFNSNRDARQLVQVATAKDQVCVKETGCVDARLVEEVHPQFGPTVGRLAMGAPTRPKESPDFPYDPGGTLVGTEAACPPIEGGEGTARHDGGIFTSSAGEGATVSGRSEANPPEEAEYHSLEDISVAQSVSDWITNNGVPDSIRQVGALVNRDLSTYGGGRWKEHKRKLIEITEVCRRAQAIMVEPIASGFFSDNDLDNARWQGRSMDE